MIFAPRGCSLVLSGRLPQLYLPIVSRHSTTHFGFQNVDEEEKQRKVFHVFENVAQKYDLMNDAMSVGIHRVWKDKFVRQIMPTHNLKCLDVAGGTGDIAFRIYKFSQALTPSQSTNSSYGPMGTAAPEITLCDINPSMMEVGKTRAQKLGISNINWVEGDAEKLPFPDNSYDVYTIAFGIRNCTHIDKVLQEAHRVLKPNGRFFCLEFSRVVNPLLRKLYDVYSMQLIPVMGQLIAGDWNSYQYLVESIRRFPTQTEFSHLIQEAGFMSVHVTNYSGGICAVHSGFKDPNRSKVLHNVHD
ncbi:Ubiquinone/menaquinone biosynthesis C-methyltransferase UbiE [Paragonimus heterotremus]|uniref:2-methoxy-6-polyprenyl-1,4-benzoquinol methylase, mitochondrial n=1 Tax=Paragonimus heterotremus TaxID=100268 RepID=A0A8J4WN43_9TREM|nr:Ubiquinone/menaquinone biosynthesis C-methyltransferase UbiE [Paragonimus heterotremus]